MKQSTLIAMLLAFVFVSPHVARAAELKESDVIARGKNAPEIPVALWVENGKRLVARGADAAKAPKSAAQLHAHFLDFGGPNIRIVTVPAGVVVHHPVGTGGNADTMQYVLKGHAQVKIGNVTADVFTGDAMREPAYTETQFTAIEDTLVLETERPVPAP